MKQNYSTCCEKKEIPNYVINYVCIRPTMYSVVEESEKKKTKKSHFFSWMCASIWILFSLAVGETWWQPLVFTAPFFVPLLLVLRHFENK